MPDIHIPEPLITAHVDERESTCDWECSVYVVYIEVGGVEIMRRSYSDDAYSDAEYATDEEHALDKIRAEFGQRMKELFGDAA